MLSFEFNNLDIRLVFLCIHFFHAIKFYFFKFLKGNIYIILKMDITLNDHFFFNSKLHNPNIVSIHSHNSCNDPRLLQFLNKWNHIEAGIQIINHSTNLHVQHIRYNKQFCFIMDNFIPRIIFIFYLSHFLYNLDWIPSVELVYHCFYIFCKIHTFQRIRYR